GGGPGGGPGARVRRLGPGRDGRRGCAASRTASAPGGCRAVRRRPRSWRLLLVDEGEQGLLHAEQVGADEYGRVAVAVQHLRDVEGQAGAEPGVVAGGGTGDRIRCCRGGGGGGVHQATSSPASSPASPRSCAPWVTRPPLAADRSVSAGFVVGRAMMFANSCEG